MVFSAGTRLGPYEIRSLVGAGGMGEVYEARDTRLGRVVALKCLASDVVSDREHLARLEREARAVAALAHPNIVTLYSFEQEHGAWFLVMEFVRGRRLDQLIPRHGLPAERIVEFGSAIAGAVAAAHERGIIHRDLKPGNVMVDEDGRVRVLDFGLATVHAAAFASLDSVTRTDDRRPCGTVGYMAPEQVRGEPVDTRADIFALGATLYEMAAGARPFAGTSAADVFSAILREDPPPLAERRPDLPPRLARLIHRCLEKDVRHRLQSAEDLQHDLEDIRFELGARPSRAARRGARTRVLVAAFAAIALVVLGFTGTLIAPRIWPTAPAPAPANIESLAVLPLANLMHDRAQDYFVDGMHDALITELARLDSVRVVSRSSVMPYRDRPAGSIAAIARDLGVDAVIEGTVLRAGDRVRVTAQLILAATDEHVWAESYDRDLRDVLTLIDEVSQAIAGEIGTRLGDAEGRQPASAGRPVTPDAYDAYLRGRRVFHGVTSPSDFRDARAWYERSVALDARFARAWAGVASANAALAFFGEAPLTEALPAARAAAARALTLDPSEGSALGTLGFIALYFDWNLEAARQYLQRALALRPHEISVRHGYADYLMVQGRLDESLEQVRLMRAVEPASNLVSLFLLTHGAAAGRDEDVLAEGRRLLASRPDMPGIREVMASVLWRQRRFREALDEYAAAYPGALRGDARSRPLDESAARAAVRELADHLAAGSGRTSTAAIGVAGLYAEAGEPDRAFQWLEAAFAARVPQVLHVVALPQFDGLRGDPRYRALVGRIGIRPSP